jgi:hypothetical protein
MKDEYDFSKGERGKYSERYQQGTNIVLLDPELRESFPDDKAVNMALHEFLELKKARSK